MSDQEAAVNSRARSDASLTEDLVRLAASEEHLSAKVVSYFFGVIFAVGLFFLYLSIDRASNPLPGDSDDLPAMFGFGGAFAVLLGAIGVWASRRAQRKLRDVLQRH